MPLALRQEKPIEQTNAGQLRQILPLLIDQLYLKAPSPFGRRLGRG